MAKVVGVGLNKTGTTTLGACLTYWGFRHTSADKRAFSLWRRRDYPALLQRVAQFESFEDWPWPLVYQDIDRAFPGSKFVLTRRDDPETWFDSLCRHAEKTGPTDFRRHIYGYEMPHEYKDEHLRFYLSHNGAVRKHFKDRPADLLEACWEEGDGWDQLADFLGLERPDLPFPHENADPFKHPDLTGRGRAAVVSSRARRVIPVGRRPNEQGAVSTARLSHNNKHEGHWDTARLQYRVPHFA